MRTLLPSAFLLLLSAASAACGPADPHPDCAEIGLGTSVDVTAPVSVQLGSTVVDATRCTIRVSPGVQATGFDSVATLECHDHDARIVTLTANIPFPDFRSANPGAKIDSRSAVALEVTNLGTRFSGASDDRAAITIESRVGTVTGDDVSASYELRGVLHVAITKPTVLAPQTERVTVQPAAFDVPFTWTQGSFRADYDRCPQ
jgi:hypothetical protein